MEIQRLDSNGTPLVIGDIVLLEVGLGRRIRAGIGRIISFKDSKRTMCEVEILQVNKLKYPLERRQIDNVTKIDSTLGLFNKYEINKSKEIM